MPPCVKVLLALEIPWHPVMLPDGVCSTSPSSLIIWIVGYFILQAMISCKFQIFMFIFSPNKQTDQSATVHAWNNKWHASTVGETSKSFGAKTFKWNFIMLQVALVSFYQCFGKISPHIRQFWRAKCSCSVCTLQFGVCPGRLVLGLRLGLCSFMLILIFDKGIELLVLFQAKDLQCLIPRWRLIFCKCFTFLHHPTGCCISFFFWAAHRFSIYFVLS